MPKLKQIIGKTYFYFCINQNLARQSDLCKLVLTFFVTVQQSHPEQKMHHLSAWFGAGRGGTIASEPLAPPFKPAPCPLFG
jgi:hypothetical protein